MRDVLKITKALSDESRIRALLALRNGELCVCQIVELLQLAPSTVSKHMSVLVQADLTLCRKEGRWHYYRLPAETECSAHIHSALEWLNSAAGSSSAAKADSRLIKNICKKEREEVSSCCYVTR
jgi:ArsR family transcriptional regulator, arsenate/arsenite/antimonite-responsive transcriptional repressor